jgi:uncharacterized protein (TIGR00730 family)
MSANNNQPPDSSTIKAYNNQEFLNSALARSIRVQCELLETEQRLQKFGINNTIVMFGSSRIQDPELANRNLDSIEKEIANSDKPTLEQSKHLRAAKQQIKNAGYYDAALSLAQSLTAWSLTIEDPKNHFYICSGGGPGIMEAANRGASFAGGKSIALGISLPFEQDLNPHITQELGFEFHYFFIRKFWFLYLAKALIIFPGGFGTLDELFEMLTLLQTRKTNKYIPIVLFGSEFWNDIINFENLLKWEVIS